MRCENPRMPDLPHIYENPDVFDPSSRKSFHNLLQAGRGKRISFFSVGASLFCLTMAVIFSWLTWRGAWRGTAPLDADLALFEVLRYLFNAVLFAGGFLCFLFMALLRRDHGHPNVDSANSNGLRKSS